MKQLLIAAALAGAIVGALAKLGFAAPMPRPARGPQACCEPALWNG